MHVRPTVSVRILPFPAKEWQLFLQLRQLTVDAVRLWQPPDAWKLDFNNSLGSGQWLNKDSFFLMTRQPIQDNLGLFYIARNISFNKSLEFYLPRLVEMVSDLIDVERCRIFLYDGVKDSLFCRFITGRLSEPITLKLESYYFRS